jgi:hypothetical protein
MDLFENPFYILGVGPRSTRGEIADAAEAAALSGDPDSVAAAASALASPRKRLSAEIFFLPGVDVTSMRALFSRLTSQVPSVERYPGASPCASANFAAAGLSRLSSEAPQGTAAGIGILSDAFERIQAASLMAEVNADRWAAGVAPVREVHDVEEDLESLRLHLRQVVRSALDRLEPMRLAEAAGLAMRAGTDGGKRPPTVVVRDMADIYELESGPFFERESATLASVCRALDAAAAGSPASFAARSASSDLDRLLMNWKAVAWPLLQRARATGSTHKASLKAGSDARNSVVGYLNRGGDFDLSLGMFACLACAFEDVPELMELFQADGLALRGRV